MAVANTPVVLEEADLESMIAAAAEASQVETGNIQGAADGQVTVFGIDAAGAAALKSKLLEKDGKSYFEETQKFGAQIAGDMKTLGAMAIVFSFIGIITYIWLRFQHVSFGIAAVVALVHDVLVTLAAIAVSAYLAEPLGVLGIEDFKISLPVIAAFLTIIGYSLNDTIVVFDRVREVRGKSREITAEMLNRSVNSTLSRTLLTSITTLIVVGLLYAIGGSGIHSFAFALVIGVIVGTYSSIFVASPTLLLLNRKKK
ncbi:MAG: protein translocase subunit SecF [Planctomycetaceae bacterium]|nr:protein translocase subunit SecF [Planctomycetaceae bacterium]